MWTIVWSERAIDDLERLDRKLRARINASVERFASTGHGDVKILKGSEEYRLRVGSWRVRFSTKGNTMTITRVLPRGSAYR